MSGLTRLLIVTVITESKQQSCGSGSFSCSIRFNYTAAGMFCLQWLAKKAKDFFTRMGEISESRLTNIKVDSWHQR